MPGVNIPQIFGGALLLTALIAKADDAFLSSLISDYLWSDKPSLRQEAEAALAGAPSLHAVSRAEFETFEALLRELPKDFPRFEPEQEKHDGEFPAHVMTVGLRDGRELPVLVQLPPQYGTESIWPALLAMHGGPSRSPESTKYAALGMRDAWNKAAADAGWIVIAPAMTHVVARGRRTEERLPYEILHPDQMESIISAVMRRYPIDPNRIAATGVSLGANFSIGYAAARPDRFCAIVPVSSEGESRRPLLHNLRHVPAYVIAGARDRNIRTIEAPRAMARILRDFQYDIVYRELPARAHEGFEALYPEVLTWLSGCYREPYPRVVSRVPHEGIMPIARRVHWLEPDTRQGVIHGEIHPGNRIELAVRWSREVRIYLHDRLVDLDQPVVIHVNGVRMFEGKLTRSIPFALEQVRLLNDPARVFSALVSIEVPPNRDRTIALPQALASPPEGPLSFWEYYAAQTLRDRLPSLGFEATRVDDPEVEADEYTAFKVTSVQSDSPFEAAGLKPGDILLEVGAEPFVVGRDLRFLRDWLSRELDDVPRAYELLVLRDGQSLTLTVTLSLDPF